MAKNKKRFPSVRPEDGSSRLEANQHNLAYSPNQDGWKENEIKGGKKKKGEPVKLPNLPKA